MNEKKKVFEEYHALKALMIMAVPAIISQLITLIYNIADTWFIGLTNNPNMVAACSLVLPIYMLSVAISNLFGTGGGSLISRLLGDKDESEAKKCLAEIELKMTEIMFVLYSKNSIAKKTKRKKKDKWFHGLGLHNVKDTIEKYGGSMVACPKDDCFETMIQVPLKGKEID